MDKDMCIAVMASNLLFHAADDLRSVMDDPDAYRLAVERARALWRATLERQNPNER